MGIYLMKQLVKNSSKLKRFFDGTTHGSSSNVKQEKRANNGHISSLCYAEGRGRTGTPVKEPDFESGASAYSATSAKHNNWGSWIRTNA